MARDLFAEIGYEPETQAKAGEPRDLFAEIGFDPAKVERAAPPPPPATGRGGRSANQPSRAASTPDRTPASGRSGKVVADSRDNDSTLAPIGDWLTDKIGGLNVSSDMLANARKGTFARDAGTEEGFLDRAGSLLERGGAIVDQGLYAGIAQVTGSRKAREAAEALRRGTTGQQVAGQTTWEDVKANPVSGLGGYVLDTGIESVPGMVAAVTPGVGLGVLATSQTGNIADERARNDGRAEADTGDFLMSAPFGVGSAFLERVGAKGAATAGGSTVVRRVARGAAEEGATEFAQGILENAGGTLGTQRGFDAAEALEEGAAGAIAGAGMGGTIRAGAEVVDRSGRLVRRNPADTRTPPPGIRETAEQEAAIVTPEDEASPLDTGDIVAGRVEIAKAEAGSMADGALGAVGMPKVGTPVAIDYGDGTVEFGTMRDTFEDETGSGVIIDRESGRPLREYHDTLTDAGVRITPREPAGSPAITVPVVTESVPIVPQAAPQRGAGLGTTSDILSFIVDDLEGGAKVISDSGGVTKYGISAKGNPGIDVANLTRDEAMAIYRRKYWIADLDRLDPAAAAVGLDASINHGPAFARRIIKESGGDAGRMLQMRRAEYARLAGQDPAKYGRYAKGWENRLAKLEARIGGAPAAGGSAVPVTPSRDVEPMELAQPDFDRIDAGPIDNEWNKFAEQSGTLNVPRSDMPQIKAEHRGAMVNFLNARGIDHEEQTVAARDLKPTQAEFSPAKVQKAKDFTGGNRAILVSSDGHVVDGHHQWLAARDQGEDIRTIRLNAPIRDLLNVVSEFPSAEVDKGSTAPARPAESTVEVGDTLAGGMPVAKAAAVARGDATPAPRSQVSVVDTGTGKSVAIMGATADDLARVAAAIPNAKPVKRKDGATVYSKKYADRIRDVLAGDPNPVTPAERAAVAETGDEWRRPDGTLTPLDFDTRPRDERVRIMEAAGVNSVMLAGGPKRNSAAPFDSLPDLVKRLVHTYLTEGKSRLEIEGERQRVEGLPSPWQMTQDGEAPTTPDFAGTVETDLSREQVDAVAAIFDRAEKRQAAPAPSKQDALKAKSKSRSAAAGGDAKLRDWSGTIINGYDGDPRDERGMAGSSKKAFLDDARAYLKAVDRILELEGFAGKEGKPNRNGKTTTLATVRVNEGGPAVSGDVYYEAYLPDGRGVYVNIGTALAGPNSGASLMARTVTRGQSQSGQNQWWPVTLSASELADRLRKLAESAKPAARSKPDQKSDLIEAAKASGRLEIVDTRTLAKKASTAPSNPYAEPAIIKQLRDLDVELTQVEKAKTELEAGDPELARDLKRITIEGLREQYRSMMSEGAVAGDTGLAKIAERLRAVGEQVPSTERSQVGNSNQAENPAKTGENGGNAGNSEYGANNRLVTQERAEELRKRLKEKLNRLNAGIDPEILAIGTELAVFHIEAGARRFRDLARAIAADLDQPVADLRLYLRGWYNGARDMMEDSGESVAGMDDADEVGRAMRTFTDWGNSGNESVDAGLPNRLSDGNARAGAEDVQRAAPDGRDGSAPGQEGRGSPADVRRDDQGPADDSGNRGAAGSERGGAGDRAGLRDADNLPARERDAGNRSSVSPARAAGAVKGTDWLIEPGSLDEGRSFATKARDNVEAIALVKQIEREGRPATRDEQTKIAKYVGWGGLKNAFPDAQGNYGKGFEDVGPRLRELLTDEEYETARRSIQYAHYTGETVVRAMWGIAEQLGFKGGMVFEPGMGTGNFRGMIPPSLVRGTSYSGLEYDHLTAAIAKLLYPQSGVMQADYTRIPGIKNAVDLVIGNPPFSETAISSDPEYGKHKFLLHDFFFAKSLDAVKPGGLLMFVTSAGTMNKRDTKARQYLADRADLVGAIRLPGNAFEKNAGTSVTTDIVILRKRAEGEAAGDTSWIQTVDLALPDRDGNSHSGAVNRYFAEHPEMVLGEQGFFDKLVAGPRYAVRAPAGFDLVKALEGAAARLPGAIVDTAPKALPTAVTTTPTIDLASGEKKDGSYYIAEDGRLMQYRGGAGRPVEAPGKGVTGGVSKANQEKIKGLIPVRDALREVYSADVRDDAADGAKARKKLNAAYDAFVKKFGPINKTEVSYRKPTVVQMESARAEAREAARLAGAEWEEGSFDIQPLLDRKASLAEIARERAAAREQAERMGRKWDEGSFDPSDVPDTVIQKRPNLDPFSDDEESYRLSAIEHYDVETGQASKGRAFTENAIRLDAKPKIDSPQDALLYSLNRLGRPDLDMIAQMAGMSRGEAIEALGETLFEVPGKPGTYETAEMYLSGNVREKLATARAAADRNPDLARNVRALEAAQPAPLTPSEIAANLGMPWIPTETIETFATGQLGLQSATVKYLPKLAQWTARGDSYSAAAKSTWGTERMDAFTLIEAALNRQTPQVFDRNSDGSRTLNTVETQAAQDKMEAIKTAFRDWIWTDEARTDKLVELYNETYNSLVAPKFDGSYLTTPGINAGWQWRPHQRAVVARIVQAGNTYMAHEVGAGKTSAMIGAGMEMKRLGLVNKPMYVVPNHMLGQFTKEFYEQYPLARIRVADERRFHTSTRKQFIAQVAADDLDAVIITHSAFGYIPISNEFMDGLIADQVADLTDLLAEVDKSERVTRRKIEQQKEQLEQRLAGRKKAGDQVFTFEEMGVDFLFVDEAHMFRKLDFATKMGNVKGIDPQGSQASFDLYAKSRYLETIRPGRNLVLASGTPITNTMAELYSISRYLQTAELEKRGLGHFDAWAGAFGDTVTALEDQPGGGYKSQTRFAKFVNVPELSVMVRQVMDVVGAAELRQYVSLPTLKNGERTMVAVEMTEAQADYKDFLAGRMRAIEARSGPPKAGDDIILSVINDGRKAAIDMRLIDASAPREKGSKLETMIANVAERYQAFKRVPLHQPLPGGKGYSEKPVTHGPATQMIFSNFGINGDFPVHKYIKNQLVALGVPEREIALITDYKSHVAKQRLFNDMNEGKVRILIGSVAKMGTGVNAQKRLRAIHNMDALWYPADDTQRNGRAIRQGNMNPEVEILDYATEGTYDSNMWAMMARKGKFIEGFMRGDPTMRDMEDLGEASVYEQAAALTTSDARIMDLTEWKQELEKLQRRKVAHERGQHDIRMRIESARDTIERNEKRVPLIEQDIATRALPEKDAFTAKVGGKSFDDATEFGAALLEALDGLVERAKGKDLREGVATFGGFSLVGEVVPTGDGPVADLVIKRAGGRESVVRPSADSRGTVTKLENALRKFDTELTDARDSVEYAKRQVADYTPKLGATFDDGGKMADLREKIGALEATLANETKAAEAARAAQSALSDGEVREPKMSLPRDADLPLVATLTGKEVATASDVQGRRAQVAAWFKRTLRPKVVTASDGVKVRFGRQTLSKLGSAGDQILAAFPAVEKIITDGVYLGDTAPSAKWAARGVVKAHEYAARVSVGGVEGDYGVIVHELADGRRFYYINDMPVPNEDVGGQSSPTEGSAKQSVPREVTPDAGINLFRLPEARKGDAGNSEQIDAGLARLQDELRKMGLANKVAVRLLDTMGGANGSYVASLITVARDGDDTPVFTLHHEAVHALRDMGVFTPADWALLVAKAKRTPGMMRQINRRYLPIFRQQKMTGAQMEDALNEEAVADLFAMWQRGDYQAKGTIERLFQRLRGILDAVKRAFGQQRERTGDDVLGEIADGTMGARAQAFTSGGARGQVRPTFGRKMSEPYEAAPDGLMGFAKDPSRQRGFAQNRYPVELDVSVNIDGDVFDDTIEGLNRAHAIERARRNWPGAKIEPIGDPRRVEKFSLPERDDMVELGATDDTTRGKMAAAFDRWRTAVQDRYLPLLKVQREIEQQTGQALPNHLNPYLGEELMTGRIGAQLEKLSEDMVAPLFDAMAEEGINTAELESYLYARHAPERNARIAEINPDFAEGEGSGMTDLEARAIMNRIDREGKTEAMERLARRIDAIRDFSVDYRVESGLMSEEQAAEWRDTYEYYVPLRGFAETDGDPAAADRINRSGGGINVRGKESKAAYGRRSKADSPLAYLILQAEESIVRGETNRVAQRFVRLAQENPSDGFWKVQKSTAKRRINEDTGLVEDYLTHNLTAEDKDWTVTAKFDGKERRVTMDRSNPAARRLADAMRHLTQQQMDWVTLHLGKVNRFLSAVNTSYNLEFVVTNAFRDVQTATINMAGLDVKGLTAGTIRDYPSALKAALKGAFRTGDGEWRRWFDEFIEAGGRVSFNQVEDVAEIKKRIEKSFAMAAAKRGDGDARLHVKRTFMAAKDLVENLNSGVENAVRLSAYKNARQRGVPVEQAASLAKNLTVNFNRRGTAGPALNAAYLFFNASVQGSTRIFQAMRSPKVRKILAGVVVLGFALEMLNAMTAGDDDDEENFYDKVPDYEKERNLIIMLPGGEYVKIPLPYGYNAFFGTGRSIAEVMRRGGDRWQETMSNWAGMVVDAFNPVGGTNSLLNFISPTIVDPVVDLTLNRDFADKPIMPDQPAYDSPMPDNQRYWGSIAPHWKAVTDFLNEATGGDKVVPGAIDVSPATLEYLSGVVVGAAGAFADRMAGMVSKGLDPATDLETNDFVMVRKVLGDKAGWYDKSAYYDRMETFELHFDRTKDYLDAEMIDEARAYANDHAAILSLELEAKAAQKAMKAVRKERKGLNHAHDLGKLTDDQYQRGMEIVKTQEDAVVKGFNTAWNRAMKQGE